MEGIYVFRVLLVTEGFLLLGLDFYCFAKRKLTDGIALLWILCSLSICAVGFAPLWDRWARLIGVIGGVLMAALCALWLLAVFWITTLLSQLIKKNNELAMQVSLLNQENEIMLKRIEGLSHKVAEEKGEMKYSDEKTIICD